MSSSKLLRLLLLMSCSTSVNAAIISVGGGTIAATGGTVKQNQANMVLENVGVTAPTNAQLLISATATNVTVKTNTIQAVVTGSVNPPANTITQASQTITTNPGKTSATVNVSGTSTVQGNAALEGVLSLSDITTVANIAIPVISNVSASGGTISLMASTKQADGTAITGPATINLNGNSYSLPGQAATYGSTLTLVNAGDLQFNSKITLTGEWIFSGPGFVSGNGNILDLTYGGTIRIRPHTPISFTSLKIKGLGYGQIIFDDTTSQLSTSFVEVEMNKNVTFTTGGIYGAGPTNIVTKNNILQFALNSSLTVDGIALTYDTTTFPDMSNIVTYTKVTFLNNGIIRPLNTAEIVRATSNTVLYLTKNNSNTLLFLERTDSNAKLFFNRNNSNAIIATNNALSTFNQNIRTNSNAAAFGIKNNSNALLFLNKNNSNTLMYGNRYNSNTLLYLERTDSAAKLFLTKNNSNTLLFLNRTNSNASLFLTKNNSNTLMYGNRYNSNTLLYLERTDSAAKLFLTKNNSNTLLFLNKNNSNAIIAGNTGLRATSNALLFLNKNNSNTLLYGNRYNSNTLLYLERTDSAAKLFLTKNNSNTLLFLNRTNSNASLFLTKNNSNTLMYGNRYNSNTLLYLERTDSAAKLFLTKNNSNTLLFLNRTNSNASLFLTKNNSNTLMYGNRYNSNTLLYLERTDSAAKLFLTKNNSNALLFLNRTNSNALKFGIKNNSNTLLFLERTDSATKLFLTKNNSNAIVLLTRENSNTLLGLSRQNSNALLFLNKNNSNTLLYLERTDSAAKLFLTKNNSNTLLFLNRTNSNAFKFGIKNNSNTLLFLNRTNSNASLFLTKNNSNTLLYLHRTDSNAILDLTKNNSNTLLELAHNNSSALLFLNRNNSNTILYLSKNNSNSLEFGIKNNSNSLLFLNRNNSNTILYVNRTNSNTDLFLTKNNSNAIVWLNTQLQTIDHGPLDIYITTSYYALRFDIHLSGDHRLHIETSTVINGRGHGIFFGSNSEGIVSVVNSANVVFEDVIFRNYNDNAFLLGSNDTIVFGNQTYLELDDMQIMQRPWTFVGQTEVRGYDNIMMLSPLGSIVVNPGSQLTMRNVSLTGLKGNNISCADSTSSVLFQDCNLCMDNNFSLTSGYFMFAQDVIMSGTNTFSYETDSVSTVGACSSLTLNNLTFSYAPSVANRDLIALQDQSAIIYMDSCSLVSTTTGMRLTNGQLTVNGNNSLINTGAVATSQGFAFGNGNAANDLDITILPGASLNLTDGIIDYANVN